MRRLGDATGRIIRLDLYPDGWSLKWAYTDKVGALSKLLLCSERWKTSSQVARQRIPKNNLSGLNIAHYTYTPFQKFFIHRSRNHEIKNPRFLRRQPSFEIREERNENIF